MVLLKSQNGIAAHVASGRGSAHGLSGRRRRPRPLLLERLENRLCLSMWTEPVNLGPVVNSSSNDSHPALSPDGLSLYITSTRPGGVSSGIGTEEIWVSRRASLNDPWGPPQNLGPTINYPDFNTS